MTVARAIDKHFAERYFLTNLARQWEYFSFIRADNALCRKNHDLRVNSSGRVATRHQRALPLSFSVRPSVSPDVVHKNMVVNNSTLSKFLTFYAYSFISIWPLVISTGGR